jgi:isoquinoline 1-oxidoreductase beta subunit
MARGPRYPRLDLPAKADGSFVFAGDVRVPGMVHAAIVHGPQGDTVLSSFDRKAAEQVPGVVGVVQSRRWVAAAAKTWHAAHKAVLAMEPRFHAAGRIADFLLRSRTASTPRCAAGGRRGSWPRAIPMPCSPSPA